MLRVVSRVVAFGCLLLVACSGNIIRDGEGDGGESSSPSLSPPQKCQAYAKTWCGKSFGCYVKVGRMSETDRQRNVDQCYQLIVDRLPCSEVTTIGADYDKCVSQIEGMPCSKWDVPTSQFGTIVPPTSCDTALSF